MITYYEFVELARQEEFKCGTYFVTEYLENPQRQLEEQGKMPLTGELVMAFARNMQNCILGRLDGIYSDPLYTMIYNDGRAFLRAIHGLAARLGINLDAGKIDSPMTWRDIAVSRGYVGINDKGNSVPKITFKD